MVRVVAMQVTARPVERAVRRQRDRNAEGTLHIPDDPESKGQCDAREIATTRTGEGRSWEAWSRKGSATPERSQLLASRMPSARSQGRKGSATPERSQPSDEE